MVSKAKKVIRVDGHLKLANSLELYPVKGHSLGGQVIVVPTEKGRYVLCDDVPAATWALFSTMDKIMLMDSSEIQVTPVTLVTTQRFIGSGFVNNLFGLYDSCNLILALAEKPETQYILPSHETSAIAIKYFG